MFRYFSNYSTAPVSPLDRAAPVHGRDGYPAFAGPRAESARHEQGERRDLASAPAVRNGLREGAPSPEGWAAAIREFEKQQEESAPERAYLAMGRNALRHGELRENSAGGAALLASVQAGASSPMPVEHGFSAGAASESRGSHAERTGPAPGEASGRSEAAENKEARTEGGNLSGGEELRSPERSFLGASADSGKGALRRDGNSAQGEGEPEKDAADPERDLSQEEQQLLDELKKRDQEVRRHEQAHISAGSGLVAGGASYQKTTGPDGKQYAVGGEVQIDTSESADPDATVAKARKVRAAALAPAEPSGQDRLVASKASQMENQALLEKSKEAKEPDAGEPGVNAEDTAAAEAGETGEGQDAAIRNTPAWRASGAYRRASGVRLPAPHGLAFSLAV